MRVSKVLPACLHGPGSAVMSLYSRSTSGVSKNSDDVRFDLRGYLASVLEWCVQERCEVEGRGLVALCWLKHEDQAVLLVVTYTVKGSSGGSVLERYASTSVPETPGLR